MQRITLRPQVRPLLLGGKVALERLRAGLGVEGDAPALGAREVILTSLRLQGLAQLSCSPKHNCSKRI